MRALLATTVSRLVGFPETEAGRTGSESGQGVTSTGYLCETLTNPPRGKKKERERTEGVSEGGRAPLYGERNPISDLR